MERPAMAVEVRNSFDGRWTRGFELVGREQGACVLRRASDGTILPVPVPEGSVRVAGGGDETDDDDVHQRVGVSARSWP